MQLMNKKTIISIIEFLALATISIYFGIIFGLFLDPAEYTPYPNYQSSPYSPSSNSSEKEFDTEFYDYERSIWVGCNKKATGFFSYDLICEDIDRIQELLIKDPLFLYEILELHNDQIDK